MILRWRHALACVGRQVYSVLAPAALGRAAVIGARCGEETPDPDLPLRIRWGSSPRKPMPLPRGGWHPAVANSVATRSARLGSARAARFHN